MNFLSVCCFYNSMEVGEGKMVLTVLLERTERIDKNVAISQTDNKKINLKLETDIEPTLQLILENQTEVIKEKSHITVIEGKQEELKDRVDVIEYAVKKNQTDIEELKKRA